ncbi:MAG: hypothetical protein IID06_02485 [Gemmatimonadetes bacterium]|nr:hypothetical protein [Gemmatimonadota bacterium]
MVRGVLVLIPVFALSALAISARASDGPSVVFGGGPLVAGELVTGPEPDWSFARDVRTIELQLLDPPRSFPPLIPPPTTTRSYYSPRSIPVPKSRPSRASA